MPVPYQLPYSVIITPESGKIRWVKPVDETTVETETELKYQSSSSVEKITLGRASTTPFFTFLLSSSFEGLGIGTTDPSTQLHVVGDLRVTGKVYDNNNSAGTNGYILQSTGTGFQWVNPTNVGGNVNGTGTANYVPKWSDTDTLTNSLIFDDGSKIGIGTTSPSDLFTIVGNQNTYGTIKATQIGGYSYQFVIDVNNASGPMLRLGTASTAGQYFDLGAWGGINNFDSKTRDLKLYNAGGYLYIQNSTGNVGVGTATPGDKLHLQTGSVRISSLTASRALTTDANSSVAVSAVTSTELGYVSGVTSAIQTQLDNKQPLDSTLTSLASFNTNGLVTQTAADTFTGRTLTGTTNRITVTNGDGVSGNPTVDISTSYVGQNTITTLGTISTGTWQATAIASGYGGTGFSTYAAGDLIYASALNTLSKLGIGTTNQILSVSGGLPAWTNITSLGIGGSIASGQVAYGSDTNTIQGSATFYYDGTNLGIGRTNPVYALDVTKAVSATSSASNSQLALRNSNTTDNNWTEIGFYGSANIAAGFAAQNTSHTNSYADLAFFTRGATVGWGERMRILSGGNVGIGITNPTYTLDVVKQVYTTTAFSANNHFAIRNTSTNPNNWTELAFHGNGVMAAGIAARNTDHTNGYGDLAFFTRDSNGLGERIRVLSSGNVGVGVTNPQTKLQMMYGTSPYNWANPPADTIVDIKHTTNAIGLMIRRASNTDWNGPVMQFAQQYGDTTSGVIQKECHLGQIRFSGWDNTTTSHILGAAITAYPDTAWVAGTGNANLIFATNNNSTGTTERMRLTYSGRLGIGTTNPTGLLEVKSIANSAVPTLVLNNNGAGGDSRNTLSIANSGNYGTAIVITDTSFTPTISITKSTGASPSSYNCIGLTYTGTYQQTPMSGTYIGSGFSFTVTHNTYAGVLYGGQISATANYSGATAYGLYVTSASTFGNSYPGVFMGGNVGIGTSSPADKLHIQTGSVRISSLTASRALTTDANSSIAVSAVTSTELGYVSGVTSAIQTQLDNKQPLDSTLTALAAFNTNGLLTQTAADTFTGRTLTGTTDRVTITNGDGVAGNPTVDIASTYVGQNTITTLGTISSGTWQGTAIASGYGGTGFSTYATGDLIYASATDTLSKLGIGTSGYVLSVVAGVPSWVSATNIGGNVNGSGTASYIPKWSDADTLTNSVLYDSGTRIGIGTTVTNAKLEIVSTITQIRSSYQSNIYTDLATDSAGVMKITPSGGNTIINAGSVAGLQNALTIRNNNTLNDGTSGVGLHFAVQDTETGKGTIAYRRTGGYGIGDFYFLQNTGLNSNIPTFADAVMVIKNDGKVGIGTTSPSSKLHVDGGALVTTSKLEVVTTSTQIRSSYQSDIYTDFLTDSAGVMKITPTGGSTIINAGSVAGLKNALILRNNNTLNDGTSGVGLLFSIQDTETGKGAIAYRRTGGYGVGDFYFLQNTEANNNLPTFADAVVVIKNDGKVGVGLTNPAYRLDVTSTSSQLHAGPNAYTGLFVNTTDVTFNRSFRIDNSVNSIAAYLQNTDRKMGFSYSSVGNPILFQDDAAKTFNLYSAGDLIISSSSTERLRFNSSGQVMVNQAGTSSAPVFSKTDDTNTGLYFPAADNIGFVEGGVEIIRITNGARVGVATTSPTGRVEIQGFSNATTPVLVLDNKGSANNSGDALRITTTGTIGKSVVVTDNTFNITFDVAKTTVAELSDYEATGFKFVGTYQHSLGAGSTLGKGFDFNVTHNAVAGTLYGGVISATANYVGSTVYGLHVTTASTFGTAYSAVFMGGSVGIGTTAPLDALHVNGSIKLGGNDADLTARKISLVSNRYIEFTATGFNLSNYYGSSGYFHKFGFNGTVMFTVNAENYISTGTGSSGTNLSLRLSGASSTENAIGSVVHAWNAHNKDLRLYTTQPYSSLGQNLNAGNIYLDTGVGFNSGTTGFIAIRPGGVEQVRVSATGDVGIGTAAPADRLHIQTGSIRISSLTASRALTTDANSSIAVSTVTSTELGYVSGVTSAIQTQLDNKQPLDSTLTALAAFNTNGILAQTAADTFTGRTLTGTTNRVTITNGDGVAGNPTVDISTSYVGQNTITTLGAISTGTWQATTIASGYGGTGFSTYTTGDLIYASATDTLSKLGIGTTGQILSVSGGVPVWSNVSSVAIGGSIASGQVAYGSGANTIQGSSTFYYDGANLGIGTTSPQYLVDIVKSSTSTTAFSTYGQLGLRNPNTTANNWTELGFRGSGVIAAGIAAQNTDHANSYANLAFFTRGSGGWAERMRILSTGSVGIGITNPTGLFELKGVSGTSATTLVVNNNGVANDSRAGVSITVTGQFGTALTITDTTHSPCINITKSTGSQLSGYNCVGFSYTGTYQQQPMYGNTIGKGFEYTVSHNTYAGVLYGGTISATANYSGATAYGLYVTSASTFGSSYPAVFMGGNVGIGTSTPSSTLHVQGDVRITGALYDSSNSAGTSGYILKSTATGIQWVSAANIGGNVNGTGTTNKLPKWSDTDTLTDSILYDDGSNLGVGTTTATETLHVQGSMRLTGKFADANNTGGTSGQLLKTTGTGVEWTDLAQIGILTYVVVTGTTQTAASNKGYIANNASEVVITLPTTSSVGDIIEVIGLGAGGWKIAQNVGQAIRCGPFVSTTGTSGYITNGPDSVYDYVRLICVVANSLWMMIAIQGNPTMV